MVNIKDRAWLVSIISGILGLIAIFTPSIWREQNLLFWMWGLNFRIQIGVVPSKIQFNFITLLTLLGSVVLLIVGIFTKKTNKHNLDPVGIFGGIVLIIMPIFAFIETAIYGFIHIPFYISFTSGILGLSVWILRFKIDPYEIKLDKRSKIGISIIGFGFIGYLIFLFLLPSYYWVYPNLIGPLIIFSGLTILIIGLIRC